MSDRDNNNPGDNTPGEDPLSNLFGMLFGEGGPNQPGQPNLPHFIPLDAASLGQFVQQLQNRMGATGNATDVAKRTAIQKVPTPDPDITEEIARSTHDSFRLAELWLEKVTDMSTTNDGESLTRKQWAQASVGGWIELVEPMQATMSRSMVASTTEQMPEELRPILATMAQVMQGVSASMFGAQVGEALGELSGTVLTGTEYNLPILPAPTLIESNLTGAAAEMDVDPGELRIYLACLELAKRALFASTPWLEGHIRTALAKYASNIEIDTSRIQDLANRIDPHNLQNISEELGDGLFRPVYTEAGEQAKASLTRILSTVAGWADLVTYQACEVLTGRDEIREALRQRMTMRSDSEDAFSQLIGLDLTPTRLRDAAALFTYLESTGGAKARDGVFSHPDTLPATQDLDDPLGYTERRKESAPQDDDMDAELRRLLDEESGS